MITSWPEPLPAFRYHPDPLATGSVRVSPEACLACGSCRGYIYVGPVYADQGYDEGFCPWCVADGTASKRFGAEFTDVGWGVPSDVPASSCDEIACRTPGFETWQQDHWLYHCGDGCAFLGRIGRGQLDDYPEALAMLMHEHDAEGWDRTESSQFVASLSPDGEATAYLFRCLSCDAYLAFSDSA